MTGRIVPGRADHFLDHWRTRKAKTQQVQLSYFETLKMDE